MLLLVGAATVCPASLDAAKRRDAHYTGTFDFGLEKQELQYSALPVLASPVMHAKSSEPRAGTFDFDLEEQELDESTVRQRVLEEMRFYASARGAAKSASPGAASEASARTAETIASS